MNFLSSLVVLVASALSVTSSPSGCADGICGEKSRVSFCMLQPVTGPCKSKISRFFYNATSLTCEKFNYGGCRGNVNNFESSEECFSTCGNDTSAATLQSGHDVCFLQRSEGEGRESIESFYYDVTEKQCLPFQFKGTGGNDNRFDNRYTCWQKCKKANSGEICEIPQAETSDLTCMAFFKRFRYNLKTYQCEQFIYGGCSGYSTANNFFSKEQCQKICYNKR